MHNLESFHLNFTFSQSKHFCMQIMNKQEYSLNVFLYSGLFIDHKLHKVYNVIMQIENSDKNIIRNIREMHISINKWTMKIYIEN